MISSKAGDAQLCSLCHNPTSNMDKITQPSPRRGDLHCNCGVPTIFISQTKGEIDQMHNINIDGSFPLILSCQVYYLLLEATRRYDLFWFQVSLLADSQQLTADKSHFHCLFTVTITVLGSTSHHAHVSLLGQEVRTT